MESQLERKEYCTNDWRKEVQEYLLSSSTLVYTGIHTNPTYSWPYDYERSNADFIFCLSLIAPLTFNIPRSLVHYHCVFSQCKQGKGN